MRRQFAAGVLIGLPLAVAGVVFGIPGMAGSIFAVGLIAALTRSPMLLAGGLVGLGATWLVLFANQALLCARPDHPCGGTPLGMVPWLVFAAAILLAGAAIVIGSVHRAGRRG